MARVLAVVGPTASGKSALALAIAEQRGGEIDLETAIARTARDVRAYSRRQMTWFRRDAAVRWCDPTSVNSVAFATAVLHEAA